MEIHLQLNEKYTVDVQDAVVTCPDSPHSARHGGSGDRDSHGTRALFAEMPRMAVRMLGESIVGEELIIELIIRQ